MSSSAIECDRRRRECYLHAFIVDDFSIEIRLLSRLGEANKGEVQTCAGWSAIKFCLQQKSHQRDFDWHGIHQTRLVASRCIAIFHILLWKKFADDDRQLSQQTRECRFECISDRPRCIWSPIAIRQFKVVFQLYAKRILITNKGLHNSDCIDLHRELRSSLGFMAKFTFSFLSWTW